MFIIPAPYVIFTSPYTYTYIHAQCKKKTKGPFCNCRRAKPIVVEMQQSQKRTAYFNGFGLVYLPDRALLAKRTISYCAATFCR